VNWRGTQAESRQRYLNKFDAAEVERYENWIRQLTPDDERACLQDIAAGFHFQPGMSVLDVGAGTGAMCQTLLHIPQLQLTALEPAPAMIAVLKSKPQLSSVRVQGFCDAPSDREHFAAATFDAVVSRQLMNGLFDPMAAIRNWICWLKPQGTVIAIDGFYDRSAWTGPWAEEVDVLPMSACRSMAMAAYLMEHAGLTVTSVSMMEATNARPSTRTPRYVVIATKP
jgi:ubiquinone/menaquinone biosynthesis C-methylase UbiE